MRLLLLTDEEADFLKEALETWQIVHAAEMDKRTDNARVHRFHVQRKLEGKYTKDEVEQVGQTALGMMR